MDVYNYFKRYNVCGYFCVLSFETICSVTVSLKYHFLPFFLFFLSLSFMVNGSYADGTCSMFFFFFTFLMKPRDAGLGQRKLLGEKPVRLSDHVMCGVWANIDCTYQRYVTASNMFNATISTLVQHNPNHKHFDNHGILVIFKLVQTRCPNMKECVN